MAFMVEICFGRWREVLALGVGSLTFPWGLFPFIYRYWVTSKKVVHVHDFGVLSLIVIDCQRAAKRPQIASAPGLGVGLGVTLRHSRLSE